MYKTSTLIYTHIQPMLYNLDSIIVSDKTWLVRQLLLIRKFTMTTRKKTERSVNTEHTLTPLTWLANCKITASYSKAIIYPKQI